jgi:hypothetical protein
MGRCLGPDSGPCTERGSRGDQAASRRRRGPCSRRRSDRPGRPSPGLLQADRRPVGAPHPASPGARRQLHHARHALGCAPAARLRLRHRDHRQLRAVAGERGLGATITSAVEKDPPPTGFGQTSPEVISGSTATFEMDPGTSPLNPRGALVTVRLSSSVPAGGTVEFRATIDTYRSYCATDYRPADNVSTVFLSVPGSPPQKPTPTPKPTPKSTPKSTPKPTPRPSPSVSTPPSPTLSPPASPSTTARGSAAAAPAPGPVPTASHGLAVALTVGGAGIGGAVLVGRVLVLRRRVGPDE